MEGIVKGNENGFQYETYEEFRDEILKIAGDTAWRNFLVRRSGPYRAGIRSGAVRGKGMCCIRGSAGRPPLPYEAVYEKGRGVMTVK